MSNQTFRITLTAWRHASPAAGGNAAPRRGLWDTLRHMRKHPALAATLVTRALTEATGA